MYPSANNYSSSASGPYRDYHNVYYGSSNGPVLRSPMDNKPPVPAFRKSSLLFGSPEDVWMPTCTDSFSSLYGQDSLATIDDALYQPHVERIDRMQDDPSSPMLSSESSTPDWSSSSLSSVGSSPAMFGYDVISLSASPCTDLDGGCLNAPDPVGTLEDLFPGAINLPEEPLYGDDPYGPSIYATPGSPVSSQPVSPQALPGSASQQSGLPSQSSSMGTRPLHLPSPGQHHKESASSPSLQDHPPSSSDSPSSPEISSSWTSPDSPMTELSEDEPDVLMDATPTSEGATAAGHFQSSLALATSSFSHLSAESSLSSPPTTTGCRRSPRVSSQLKSGSTSGPTRKRASRTRNVRERDDCDHLAMAASPLPSPFDVEALPEASSSSSGFVRRTARRAIPRHPYARDLLSDSEDEYYPTPKKSSKGKSKVIDEDEDDYGNSSSSYLGEPSAPSQPSRKQKGKAKAKEHRIYRCTLPGCHEIFKKEYERRRHELCALKHNPRQRVCPQAGCTKMFSKRWDAVRRHLLLAHLLPSADAYRKAWAWNREWRT
ncbi:hypothetical protein OE88DRAFT_1655514 [Heliocybe sulcata]|uniref:C2H2-type domain-containing protein n=1 Tax=Heliocybe sulcata TaxID=5364 RepID=A0A5C3NII2_9AGAM|nr:hypothetical protein OE88DRAFT_1655514 [Heliocybe sulcata]